MRNIPERKRPKVTGKGAPATFVQLQHFVLRSEQFIRLDPHAKSLFMYFASLYNGRNNGDFEAPANQYEKFGFSGRDMLQKAKTKLVESGFAVVTRQGEKRRCSLYGLTVWPIDECDGKLDWPSERKASHAWKMAKSDSRVAVHKVTATRYKTLGEAA